MAIEKLIIRGNKVPAFAPATPSDNLVTLQQSFVIESGASRGAFEEHAVTRPQTGSPIPGDVPRDPDTRREIV